MPTRRAENVKVGVNTWSGLILWPVMAIAGKSTAPPNLQDFQSLIGRLELGVGRGIILRHRKKFSFDTIVLVRKPGQTKVQKSEVL